MLTAIGHPRYYTLICKLPAHQRRYNRPLHLHHGNYSDIRDLMQTIINWQKRHPNERIEYTIESSNCKPHGWIYPTRYRDNV